MVKYSDVGAPGASIADTGSPYMVATNPTPGTPITHAATQAFSATAALLTLFGNGKTLIPDYLKLLVVGTPTTATSAQLVVKVDSGNRFGSAGSTITAVNADSRSAVTSSAVLNFGAVVAGSEVAARTVARSQIKVQTAPCLTAGDHIYIGFAERALHGTLAGSTAQNLFVGIPGCVIGPAHSMVVHVFYPAVTVAPTFEFEMGWWEK